MKIGFFSRHEELNLNNGLFDPDKYSIGQGLERPLCDIRTKLLKGGHSVETVEINSFSEYELVVFVDFPKEIDIVYKAKRECKYLALIAFESDVILPENFQVSCRRLFDLVFSWSKERIAGNEVLIHWPNNHPNVVFSQSGNDSKSIALISGNKISYDTRELYSERIKFITELKRQGVSYDIFGFGWEKGVYKPTILHYVKKFNAVRMIDALCNRSKLFTKLFKENINNFKGTVDDKLQVLSNYKFNLCFENARDIEGYITEKIFDSFYAGSIPVYLGAPDIVDYIPENTFINVRDFESYGEVVNYIASMPQVEVEVYISNIKKFLESEMYFKFKSDSFASIVSMNLLTINDNNRNE